MQNSNGIMKWLQQVSSEKRGSCVMLPTNFESNFETFWPDDLGLQLVQVVD